MRDVHKDHEHDEQANDQINRVHLFASMQAFGGESSTALTKAFAGKPVQLTEQKAAKTFEQKAAKVTKSLGSTTNVDVVQL
jgi:hypothetical protein